MATNRKGKGKNIQSDEDLEITFGGSSDNEQPEEVESGIPEEGWTPLGEEFEDMDQDDLQSSMEEEVIMEEEEYDRANFQSDNSGRKPKKSKTTTRNKIQGAEMVSNFQKNIRNTAQNYKPSTTKQENITISQENFNKIVIELMRMKKCDYNTAAYGLCDLFQSGAHLRGVQNRDTMINGILISKQDIIQAMKVIKLAGPNDKAISLRSLARAMREVIHDSSRARDIPGHLAKNYKEYLILENKWGTEINENMYNDHSYYCADFQFDNPYTPLEVRKYMIFRARKDNSPRKRKGRGK